MKSLFTICIFSLITIIGLAQEVISSGGETKTATDFEISWTISEPVIETISTGTNILTQGFHQSKLTVTPITEILFPDIELKVFPNPSADYVTIYINNVEGILDYSLFDLAGKLLEKKNITTTETKLNLNMRSNGTYLLKLQNGANRTLQTFKIIKN